MLIVQSNLCLAPGAASAAQQVSARRHGKLPRRPATERPASSLPTPAAGRASQNTARTASLRPRGLDYGLPALRIWNSGSTRTQQADTAEIAVGPCPTRPSGTGPGRFSPLSWRHGPWCSASDPPSLKESAGPLRSGHRGPWQRRTAGVLVSLDAPGPRWLGWYRFAAVQPRLPAWLAIYGPGTGF